MIMEDKSLAKLLLGYENSREFIEKVKPLGWRKHSYEKGRELVVKLKDQEVYAGIRKERDNYVIFYKDKDKTKKTKKDSLLEAFSALARYVGGHGPV
jgi:uncharacterized linocin/CFP29 family protein